MNELTTCPVCDSIKLNPFLSCKDHSVTGEVFTITQCKDCTFRFTNPRPDSPDLSQYYESEDYISHSDTNKGFINRLYKIVRNITLKQKVNLIWALKPGRGAILDIGAGTGFFLNECWKNKWTISGIEPNSKARATASANFGIELFDETGWNILPSDSIDVITLWHVLEHIEDLNDCMEKINRVSKKDSFLIIAVPNHLSYDAKNYGADWAGYDVPRHLSHFTPFSIRLFLEKHNFQILQKKPMVFDAFYVSMLSEKYIRGNFLRALLIGIISTIVGGSNKNYFSSLIYIAKKK